MKDFTFRIRFMMPNRERIEIDKPELPIRGLADVKLKLSTGKSNTVIQNAEKLILSGCGYTSKEDAELAGQKHYDILTLTLAKLRIGVDFGDRSPKSAFSPRGLSMLERLFCDRVLNDVHGLTVFESLPSPKFVGQDINIVRGRQQNSFEECFARATDSGYALNEKERIAYDIFSASYFQNSGDARFLMLVMALEVLSTPVERPPSVVEHVERLIQLTKKEDNIPPEQRDSIVGSLQRLHKESINQAGKRLVEEQLGERMYMDISVGGFFSHCYKLRSKLVHGDLPFPSYKEIGQAAASLETLVADLLSGPLIEINI